MERCIDMHIHSINSDGEYGVNDLVNMIREEGINLFSITDHDSVKSVKEIANIKECDLTYIPGIEISSVYKGIKMHILGYDFNLNDSLDSLVKDIQEKRLKRFYEVISLIKKNEGLDIPDSFIEKVLMTSESLARPHIINILMDLGYGNKRDEVYKRYVRKYKSAVNYRASLEDVIEVLKSSGGKVFLAHPKEVEDEYNIDIESILPELLKLGIDGIEVYNSIHNLQDIKRYLELVKKYQICYTGGSDYHGSHVKPKVSLGKCSLEGEKVRKISLIK